jgi:hypothetical protein
VHKKGKVTQNHSGLKYKKARVAINEMMVYNQYVLIGSAADDIKLYIKNKKN